MYTSHREFLLAHGPTDTRVLGDHLFVQRLHRLQGLLFPKVRLLWPHLILPELERRTKALSQAGRRPPGKAEEDGILSELCCTLPVLGRLTAVEVLADNAPCLCDEERATLRGFTRVFLPAFEVLEVRSDRMVVMSSERGSKPITLVPGVEQETTERVQRGSLLLTRLVPVRDFYAPICRLTLIPPETDRRWSGRIILPG